MTSASLTVALVVPFGFLMQTLHAQAPVRLQFEVASVKPALSIGDRRAEASRGGPPPTIFDMRVLPGGRFVATYVTLKMLIGYAFDVKDYQIDGGPPWLTTDYFDVMAIASSDAPAEQVRRMVQTLLFERFGLRARQETRQAPVHALTVARADGRLGPRLTRTSPACEKELATRAGLPPASPAPIRPDDLTPPCGGMRMMSQRSGGMLVVMGAVELERLIAIIASSVAGPVIDRTALSGRFDVVLEYMPERNTPALPRAESTDQVPPPPLAAALQQQLGLRLEKQTGPLPVVVVDAAERPTPN